MCESDMTLLKQNIMSFALCIKIVLFYKANKTYVKIVETVKPSSKRKTTMHVCQFSKTEDHFFLGWIWNFHLH